MRIYDPYNSNEFEEYEGDTEDTSDNTPDDFSCENSYIYEKARKIAANIVGYRMYTCGEVVDKLIKKKIDKDTAERVVCDFAAAGILDDRAYAAAYVSEAVSLGGKGMYRIRQELYRKGIAKSIIDLVCDSSEEDTYSALCDYVESRGLCDNITTRNDLEKLKARLARRGFSLSEIKRCLDEYNISERYK